MFVYATPSLQRKETTGRICVCDISLLCVRSRSGGKTVPKNIYFFVEQSSVKFKTQACFCATPSLPRQKTAGRTCSLNIYVVSNNFHQVINFFFLFCSPPPSDVETLVGRGSTGHTCPEKGKQFPQTRVSSRSTRRSSGRNYSSHGS